MDREKHSTEVAERRRANRDELDATVRMRIETRTLEGLNDNISSAGLMFFTEVPLRVTVEVSTPSGTQTYSGRLVRAQRMSDTNTGIAIEFDS